ncbi:histone-lysine N-methyltransferase, partial [Trachipleistophora hominis]
VKIRPIMVFQWFYYNDYVNNPALQLGSLQINGTNGTANTWKKKIDHNLLKNIIKIERIYDIPEKIYNELVEQVSDDEEPYPLLTQLDIMTSYYCPKCNQKYDNHDYTVKMVHCDECTRWLHIECENITWREYAKFGSLPRYECMLCREWKLICENRKLEVLNSNKKNKNGILKTDKYNSAQKNNHQGVKQPENGPSRLSNAQKPGSSKFWMHAADDRQIKKNTEHCFVAIEDDERCANCKRIGATIKCLFCKDRYYHVPCAKAILVCNLVVPSCGKHRITYRFPYVGINTGLRYNNYVYYREDWYGVIINNDFLERRGDYLYLNDRLVQVCALDKIFGKKYSVEELSLEQLFGLYGRGYAYFTEKCMSRPDILSNILFDANIEEMVRSLDERPEYSHDTIQCSSLNAIKVNPTLTHLISHLRCSRPKLSKSAVEGYGLFSTRLYDKDEPIIEYVGELIDDYEADKREKIYKDRIYMFRKNSKIILDATVVGNLAKYINHSCEPNCYATKVICGTASCIIICAKRIITKNEELSYDYNLSKGAIRFECRCNSSNCRGTLD